MLRTLFVFTLLGAALAANPAAADVYKYKDDHGNVLYTDKPTTLPAERLNVQSQKTDVVAVQARQEAEQKRLAAGDDARQQATQARSDQQEATEINAKDKAERCAKARERYDSYITSQRLYEQQPNGERRYLTEQELDTARAAAKASMDAMCQ